MDYKNDTQYYEKEIEKIIFKTKLTSKDLKQIIQNTKATTPFEVYCELEKMMLDGSLKIKE